MIEISKELLSEVLGFDVVKIEIKDNILDFDCAFDAVVIVKKINIYELAHKCKEWALNKNYILLSSIEIDCSYCDISFIINNKARHKLITGASEIEAIFKACEWILKEIKK